MRQLHENIAYTIKKLYSSNHRCVFYLMGKEEENYKNLSVICNLIEINGTKEVLYLYKKDNKLKKQGMSITHLVKKYFQRNCTADIRWCLYDCSKNILGRTYDICVFNDYKSLTPNVIARGMETVKGGGFIIFLTPSWSDLKEMIFYDSKKMYHSPRFLSRFTKLMLKSNTTLCMDKKFNLMNPKKVVHKKIKINQEPETNLNIVKSSLKAKQSQFFQIIDICCTYDQARCVQSFFMCIDLYKNEINCDESGKRYPIISLVTADRGRGKSAALGLSICAALISGIDRIKITSPSISNIATVWEFLKKALKALKYSENCGMNFIRDAESNEIHTLELSKLNGTIQLVEYFEPSDSIDLLCDMLCIDEAAALPADLIQRYLHSFDGITFLSTTMSGYESNGVYLTKMLLNQLKQEYLVVNVGEEYEKLDDQYKGRLFDIILKEPIRYGQNDPVESFLYNALCMEQSLSNPTIQNQVVPPLNQIDHSNCTLYEINRDILFNGKKQNEKLLNQITSLLFSNSSQNSPNDLQILANNYSKRLLVLTNSLISNEDNDINLLVLIIVRFEGEINQKLNDDSNDLQMIDETVNYMTGKLIINDFRSMNGVIIEFIGTNPYYQNQGFGKLALKFLDDHFSTPVTSIESVKKKQKIESILNPLSYFPNYNFNFLGVNSTFTVPLVKFFKSIDGFYCVLLEKDEQYSISKYRGIFLKQLHKPNTVTENWLQIYTDMYYERFKFFGHYEKLPSDLRNAIFC